MKSIFRTWPITILIFALATISVMSQTQIGWEGNATALRGRNNQQFSFVCPGNGSLSGAVWGTDLYTDDSSICTAAVHAGRIDQARGGTVTIEIRPGASSYVGSARNGVTSRGYGGWSGSYVIIGAIISGDPEAIAINWATNATGLRGKNGQRFLYRCPPGGTLTGAIWGTDIYTDDSSICTAAVHAGFIEPKAGGTITLEVRPGAASYQGSARNGVTSRGYGGWSGSFAIVRSTKDPVAKAITWSANVTDLRGQNGQLFRFSCPAGGSLSAAVWGTDIYTDDSAVCVAAVHRGLITVANGGTVTVEIRPGASGYAASSRNGVNSRPYGGWSGSYIFR